MASTQATRESRTKTAVIWTLYAALCVIVDYSVFAHGLPMLRHDWRFPNAQRALGSVLADFSNGWVTSGIGSPQPYPTFYYIGFLLWPLHALLSPLGTVTIIVTAAVLLLAASARSIAATTGSGVVGTIGLAAFTA